MEASNGVVGDVGKKEGQFLLEANNTVVDVGCNKEGGGKN